MDDGEFEEVELFVVHIFTMTSSLLMAADCKVDASSEPTKRNDKK
jgi:hypothetical protein